MLVLDLDPAAAAQLATAISRHRIYLRAQGQPVAAELAHIEEAAARAYYASSRQTATNGDTPPDARAVRRDDGGDGCEPLTIGQVAAALRVSTRTVGRMLDRGDLPSVPVGKRRRVHRADLDRYLDHGAA